MKHLFEYNDYNHIYTTLSYNEMWVDMISMSGDNIGIPNIVIWVGKNSVYEGNIIKVSNLPNNFKGTSCFTITIPELKVIVEINKELITYEILEEIIKFVQNNMDIIIDFSNDIIDVDTFIEGFKPNK